MKVQKLHSSIKSKLQSGLIVTDVTQCVLELVENSLDAKATAIAVRIKLSKYEIEVLDNGVGISENDLDLIGKRFMTSKCHEANDLNKTLFTYGFRGQALASLLDVCQILTIRTKSGKNNILTKIFKNGKATSSFVVDSEEKCNTGTTVTVSDFMISMPVRRKRMAEVFDLNEVKTQLEYLAIIHSEVSFTLRDEDRDVILLQTHKTSDAGLSFANLFGLSIHKFLLSVNYEEENYKINGFISLKRHSENNLQFVYVNKRIVFKSLIHKFINYLIDKYFEENQDSVNESVLLQDLCSNIPKDQHNVYIMQIYCPYNYFEFFYNFRRRTVDFSNWYDVFKFIRNGICRVLNFSKKKINTTEYVSGKENMNLKNFVPGDTLSGGQLRTVAPDAFIKRKRSCNGKSGAENLESYIDDNLNVKIYKNKCHSLQKKLIVKYMKKSLLKMASMKSFKIKATKSNLLKKIDNVVRSLSESAISKKHVLEMLQNLVRNNLPTIKKRDAKKLKSFLVIYFLNFSIWLKYKTRYNTSAFKLYNGLIQRKFGELFTLWKMLELLTSQKTVIDFFFTGEEKLKSVKGNMGEERSDLGRKDGINFNNMLRADTSLQHDGKLSEKKCREEKNEISRRTNKKLSVENLLYESKRNSMKSIYKVENVERLNKLKRKKKELFDAADGTNDSGCKLTSDVNEITTNSLISHCRNRSSLSRNVKNNLRTSSETISLNRKRKRKINQLHKKKISKILTIFFNFFRFHRDLKSSFKHYLFHRKMKYFHLVKDAQVQAKILKSEKNKKTQTTPIAFAVEKFDALAQGNREDSHLGTCENTDNEYRFHKNKNEVEKKKEIESNDLAERANLIQLIEDVKTISNDCTNVKNVPFNSNELFPHNRIRTASKLPKSITLLEANDLFTKDSNNLYESKTDVKESFNFNYGFVQCAQISDNSICAFPTNEIDILSGAITKVFSSSDLKVSESTEYVKSVINTSYKNVNGQKENESEKFISNDLPDTLIARNEERTKTENRFIVSERYSFIPKDLSRIMCGKNSNSLYDQQSLMSLNWNRQMIKENFCQSPSNFMNNFEPKSKSFCNNTGSFSNPGFEVNVVEDLHLKSVQSIIHYENQIIKAELPKSALKVHNLSNSFTIPKDIIQNLKVIGQWDKKFIVATIGISNPNKMQILTIFDQHAVDERIQLEKLMQGFRTSDGKFISCDCNPPIKCVLSKSAIYFIPFLKSRLAESGIEVSVLDYETIKFHKIPLCLVEKEEENADAEKVINLLRNLITDIIREFIETRGTVSNIPTVLHNIISMKACKKAVKFSQTLSLEAMNKSIIELFECQFPFQCAHGRPTIIPVMDILEIINMEEKQEPKLNFTQFGLRMMKKRM